MEIRTLRDGELEQAWELDRDAFHSPEEARERFLLTHNPERFVGAFEAGRLLGVWAVYDMRQYFGGRSVSMAGVTSVAVVPDRRGEGLGRRLGVECIARMRERGEAISTLVPAATPFYRSLGWEMSGAHAWRRIAPSSLSGLPAQESVRVRPAVDSDFDAIRECYARLAPSVNGFLERSPAGWALHREAWRARSLFVAENREGGVVGYMAYRQLDGEWSHFDGPFQLSLDDVVWATREAGIALWRLLGSWSPQVERILYRTGAEDPLLLLLPEQEQETLAEVRWMTRLVDAEAAIAERGFPAGLVVEVPVELSDEILPANSGRWVLQVEKGRGRLEHGGPGGARFDVGSFSSLYTGWATTAALARAGRLTGGSTEERAALDAAFAGPTPWMLDHF